MIQLQPFTRLSARKVFEINYHYYHYYRRTRTMSAQKANLYMMHLKRNCWLAWLEQSWVRYGPAQAFSILRPLPHAPGQPGMGLLMQIA